MSAGQKKRKSPFLGIFLLFLGTLLLLDRMDWIHFDRVIRTYWPLILIGLGLKIILFPKEKQEKKKKPPSQSSADQGNGTGTASFGERKIFGDIRARLITADSANGKYSTLFGDIQIDARNMTLDHDQKTLKIDGLFGNIRLELNESIPCLIRAHTFAGSIHLRGSRGEGISVNQMYKSPDFDTATARLVIVASRLAGDIEVL